MKTFNEKKQIDTFPGGHLVTDFAKAKIQVKTGNSLKEIPFGTMTLTDHENLLRKTELMSKPLSDLTLREFMELNLLKMLYEN